VQLAIALHRDPPPEVSIAYVAAIVRNGCYDMLRRRRRRPAEAGLGIECEAPEATEEERLVVDAALAALPAEQREVIYLKVFEGLTFQEIADRCGVSINTASSRYRYATAALRRTFGATGTRT
jgi:RNA polymerase sigma-70 factor (ECF subfamily)